MVINLDLERLRSTIRDLEQENLSRADRGFLIRLLRELAEATEKSPRVEGQAHSFIEVRLATEEDNRRLAGLDEKLAGQASARQAGEITGHTRDLEKNLVALTEEAFSLV
ncbi:MAG TPA: hypothetical protein VF813_01975, partial [Anaerolineaceae bacterium]